MRATVKLFNTDHSQAVRLPKTFRLPGTEVWISKNAITGAVTLTPKAHKQSLAAFFELLDAEPAPEQFICEQNNKLEQPRNPFEDWLE